MSQPQCLPPSASAVSPTGRLHRLSFLRLGLLVLCGIFATGVACAQSVEKKIEFNVPAAAADVALRQFATQSGAEILFATRAVSAARANELRGQFTLREGMALLLAGSGLEAQQDPRSGTWTVSTLPNVDRAAPAKKSDRPLEKAFTTSPGEPETFMLSPFEVSAELDKGYRAGGTLAGTRLRSDLRDIAASVSVVTKDFMNDIGASDLSSLLNYTLGTEVTGVSGNLSGAQAQSAFYDFDSIMRQPSPATRIRGLSSADTTRDFFLTDTPMDNYNIERVDINRGANSMLFGLGSPGGIVNSSTVRAQLRRDDTTLSAQIGRFGSQRETLDWNKVLIKDRLAFRLAALHSDRRFQQEFTFSRDRRAFGALTWRPFKDTTLRLNAEKARVDENRPETRPPYDQFTFWWAYGKPAFDPSTNKGVMLGTPLNASLAGITATGAAGSVLSTGLGRSFTTNLGVVYEDPNSATAGISGLPAGTNAFEAVNERLLAGGGTGGMRQIREGQVYLQFLNGGSANPAFAFWRDLPLTDTRIFNYFDHTLEGPNKHEWSEWNSFNATLEQTLFDGLAGVELSYDRQNLDYGSLQSIAGRNYTINIDINTKLPNGAVNPNFGRPFVENTGWANSAGSNREAARATAYLDIDARRYSKSLWAKAVGRHTLTANYTNQEYRGYSGFSGRAALTGLDYWAAENATVPTSVLSSTGRRALSRIAYIGPSLANLSSATDVSGLGGVTAGSLLQRLSSLNALYYQSPATNAGAPAPFAYQTFGVIQNDGELVTETTAFTPSRVRQVFESESAILQSRWFDGCLVSTLGVRRDAYRTYATSSVVTDPVTGIASTQPQDLVPLRQLDDTASTFSYGVVLHTPRTVQRHLPLGADLSLTYNNSDNFRPTAQRFTIYNDRIDPETGKTHEYGALMTLFGGALELRATHYESGSSLATNANLRSSLAQIAVLGGQMIGMVANSSWNNGTDPSMTPAQQATLQAANSAWQTWTATSPDWAQFLKTFNVRVTTAANGAVSAVVDQRTDQVVATSDVVSKGWEYEMVINPTRQWRIAVNAARQDAVRTHTAADLAYFMAQLDPIWAGTAGDLRYDNTASTLRTNFTGIYAAVKRELQLDGGSSPEVRKWRFNAVTNYTFSNGGRLRGWSVGASVRWQDEVAIGYPVVSDSIGAHYDTARPYYGPAEVNYDAWIGYGRKLSKKVRWQAQLNVRNLGVQNKLIPIAAQPDGSIAAYRIAEPVVWTLTNTFKF